MCQAAAQAEITRKCCKFVLLTLSALLLFSCGQSQENNDTPIAAIERYIDTFGSQYSQGEYCIAYSHVLAVDDANPDEILVWGDFWVENFNLEGDTLKNVSGGSHPGLMHVVRNEMLTRSRALTR